MSPIPITLLSGFLGSGKTTLLQHILRSKEHAFRCAVIVNDMAELNIDADIIKRSTAQNEKIIKKEERLVAMQNGCICCTLRSDLLEEIYELAKQGRFDYLIIESTGISEPMLVAETFTNEFLKENISSIESSDTCNDEMITDETQKIEDFQLILNEILNAGGINKFASLDTCVTVVDAANFFSTFETCDFVDDNSEEKNDDRTITDLMIDQIEFADVILLNKTDLVTAKEAEKISKIIKKLNPVASVLPTTYSKVDLTKIINTGLFDYQKASTSSGWLHSLKQMTMEKNGKLTIQSESDEYGISSFLYTRRRPFHPTRLYDLISNQFFVLDEGYVHDEDEEEEGDVTTAPGGNDFGKKGEASDDMDVDVGVEEEKRNLIRRKKEGVFGPVLRAKGTIWLATRHRKAGDLSIAGCMLTVKPSINWFCTLPKDEWDIEDELDRNFIASQFISPWGDRRQEIVVIGIGCDSQGIERLLDECLLTDEEMNIFTSTINEDLFTDNQLDEEISKHFGDPFASWEYLEGTHDSHQMCEHEHDEKLRDVTPQ